MNLDQTIKTFLQAYKNKTISLDQLEEPCRKKASYSDFASAIESLTHAQILVPFKSSPQTLKEPRLHYKYRINKPLLKQEATGQIHAAQKEYHTLNLSNYYYLPESQWAEDQAYIKQVHDYLLEHKSLPQDEILQTELAFQLVGDEKWIQEGSGQRVLERLGLWEGLLIQRHPDPLMLALNPSKVMTSSPIHYHLVVENKSTYYALLEALPQSLFTSLIYGQGWKITANLTQLEKQVPLPRASHEIHYFGDLDYEGINIWHKLNQIRKVHIAKPFYTQVLRQKESQGSKNQKRDQKALSQFLSHFTTDRERINTLLAKDRYYPQEAIMESDLRETLINYKLDQQEEEDHGEPS